jgi:hypothetical protein
LLTPHPTRTRPVIEIGRAKAPPIVKPPIGWKAADHKAPVGALGDPFLHPLKTAPHGSADSTLVMETLRSHHRSS